MIMPATRLAPLLFTAPRPATAPGHGAGLTMEATVLRATARPTQPTIPTCFILRRLIFQLAASIP